MQFEQLPPPNVEDRFMETWTPLKFVIGSIVCWVNSIAISITDFWVA